MDTINLLWYVWPWIGFGGSIVLFLLLFFSDTFQKDKNQSGFYDISWLSWFIVASYLLHVLEEYGLHVVNGQYTVISSFVEMGVDAMFGGIPLLFFPFVNILLTWIALPTAAILSKKYPVLGISGIGFVLLNGLTHIVGSFRMGSGLLLTPGNITGIFLFLPLFIWVVYACNKKSLLPKRGLLIAVISGVLAHIGLFAGYILNAVAGHEIAFIYMIIVAFMPIIFAWVLSKLSHVELKEERNA